MLVSAGGTQPLNISVEQISSTARNPSPSLSSLTLSTKVEIVANALGKPVSLNEQMKWQVLDKIH